MIVSTVKGQLALVYLANTEIFLKLVCDHLAHVGSVPCLQSNSKVSLNLKKCFFFDDPIEHLDHVMKPWKLSVLDKTTDSNFALKQIKSGQNGIRPRLVQLVP